MWCTIYVHLVDHLKTLLMYINAEMWYTKNLKEFSIRSHILVYQLKNVVHNL